MQLGWFKLFVIIFLFYEQYVCVIFLFLKICTWMVQILI